MTSRKTHQWMAGCSCREHRKPSKCSCDVQNLRRYPRLGRPNVVSSLWIRPRVRLAVVWTPASPLWQGSFQGDSRLQLGSWRVGLGCWGCWRKRQEVRRRLTAKPPSWPLDRFTKNFFWKFKKWIVNSMEDFQIKHVRIFFWSQMSLLHKVLDPPLIQGIYKGQNSENQFWAIIFDWSVMQT